MNHSQPVLSSFIGHGLTKDAFLQDFDRVVKEGTSTAPEHDDDLAEYSRVNSKRFSKWTKIYKPSEELLSLMKECTRPMHWLVITESWCGDAAQNLAQVIHIGENIPSVTLEFFYRDTHEGLIDLFLTNGGKAIPKVICVDTQTHEVLAQWGPRPAVAQTLVKTLKAKGEDYATEVHTWYAKNKNEAFNTEWEELLIAMK